MEKADFFSQYKIKILLEIARLKSSNWLFFAVFIVCFGFLVYNYFNPLLTNLYLTGFIFLVGISQLIFYIILLGRINSMKNNLHRITVDMRLESPQPNSKTNSETPNEKVKEPKKQISAKTFPNPPIIQKQEVKTDKYSSLSDSPPRVSTEDKLNFADNVIKLGEIAQSCRDLIEDEGELAKKEQTRLFLKRDEFKKLYSLVKSLEIDSF
jgi:hypothetical protein